MKPKKKEDNEKTQPVARALRKSKAEIYPVKENGELLEFLISAKHGISRNSAKSLLAHRQVYVNNVITTQYNYPLKPGMKVQISQKGKREFHSNYIKLLFEDPYLLVIEKRAGIPSISAGKKKETTAYSILTEYVQRAAKQNKVFIIHGLDKEVSGLMVFAKDEKTKFNIQDYWDEIVKEQKFVAILSGEIGKDSGAITSWVDESGKILIAETSLARPSNEKAVSSYKTIKRNNGFSMVEFTTGRRNQIRMHAFELHHPIVGDPRYNENDGDPINRIALHGFKLKFKHPLTGELMPFETPYPEPLKKLMQKTTGEEQTV